MSIPSALSGLVGIWKATHRLWLHPGNPVRESEATATVALIAHNRFLHIAYTWSDDGPQDGLLLIGQVDQSGQINASWIDSWHNGDNLMNCVGHLTNDGAFSVKGSYAVPSGPDWGWRIVVKPEAETWRLIMYNITPEGGEHLAVEAVFSRQP